MITHMLFIFPFDKDMRDYEIKDELDKIRKEIEGHDVGHSHFVGIRSSMTTYAQLGWQEITAEDFQDAKRGPIIVTIDPENGIIEAHPDTDERPE